MITFQTTLSKQIGLSIVLIRMANSITEFTISFQGMVIINVWLCYAMDSLTITSDMEF